MPSNTGKGFVKASEAVDTQPWQLLSQPSMSHEFQIRTALSVLDVAGDMTILESGPAPVLSAVDAVCQQLDCHAVFDAALDQVQLVIERLNPPEDEGGMDQCADWLAEALGVRSVNLVFTAPGERLAVSPLVRKAPKVAK